MNGCEIYVDNDTFYAISPEGQSGSMGLEPFFQKVTRPAVDPCRICRPKGVIMDWNVGNTIIWLYEREPRLYRFSWIAPDSPARFGRGTKYRDVTIALPYLLVFAVFAVVPSGRLTLSSANEAFFRNTPLTSPDDPLHFPALLNCSKFPNPDSKPLAWICTQYLDRSFEREPDLNRRMRASFKSLLHCLLETGFNYSSEHHEGNSWFTASQHIDKRIATIENWEEASKADPLFITQVPWIPTGLTAAQIAERILQNLRARQTAVKTTSDIARIIFQQKRNARQRNHPPTLL